MVRLPRNEKQTYRLHSRPQMWPSDLTLTMTLTLNFQGQIWNFLYIKQKWSDCHETKSKHTDCTLGLKCDHRIWPWPWPWPWIFKVKYGICYISTKSGPIATKQEANIPVEPHASNVTNRFDLVHDLDLWIFKVKCDLELWPHAWSWPFMTMTVTIRWSRSGDRGDFRCRRAVDSSSCFRQQFAPWL